MDGIESKLQRILNDPEAMGAVLNMAKSLSPSSGDASKGESAPAPSPEDTEESGGWSGLSGLLENIDPATLSMVMSLVGEYTRTDDRRTLFLNALKPYVREERAGKIERAAQIVKIARTASKALNN